LLGHCTCLRQATELSAELETEVGQFRMILGLRTKRPVELAGACRDADVIDARLAAAHQPDLVELPLLVAVRPVPVAAVVMP
jgi:hypothetical protein